LDFGEMVEDGRLVLAQQTGSAKVFSQTLPQVFLFHHTIPHFILLFFCVIPLGIVGGLRFHLNILPL